MIAGMLKFLLGGGANLYPFEKHIIEEVKAHLDVEGASQLQQQIEAFNKIQRLADGKEVNFYQMRHGKPAFDENLRFPDLRNEALLATVLLVNSEKNTELVVKIWLVKGRLFSLEFNKSPKKFFNGVGLKSVKPTIANVKIWFDPMHPPPANTDIPLDKSSLKGCLRDWDAKGRVSGLCTPLSKLERATYLDRIDSLLPTDYLELVEETEGMRLGNCTIFGVTGIRDVVLQDATYYVLAEIEGRGALAAKEGNHNGDLYFLDYEDNDTSLIGKSFKKAINDLQT